MAPVAMLLVSALALVGCNTGNDQQGNGGTASAANQSAVNPSEMEFPELRDFEAPEGERVELDNGLVVYLFENHELPQIEAVARIGAGNALEPSDKRGLGNVFSTVLRTGGAGERGPDEVNELLEGLGAEISTSIREDHTNVSMRALKDGVDPVLSVFADILTDPRFAEEKVNLAKSRTKSSISRRNDNPQQIAFREFGKLIHGPDSPYGWHSEHYTVDRIGREDLAAFHEAHFHPNNTQLAMVGDFDSETMAQKLRDQLGGWPTASDYQALELPPVNTERESSVNLIEKTDVTQSTVLVGHPGELKRDHPDYAAVEIMNEVLSGGFSGRLFKRVRSDQGLAYSVFGNYTAPYHRPGRFYAGVYSKSETTVEAARAVLREVEKMREEPPTDEELKLAKDAYLNSMVFEFDSLREIAGRRMNYEAYDFPPDFLTQLKDRIDAVSAEDVQRVAGQYLHPDQVHLLVVGNPAEFSEDLSTMGEVNKIDITIPTRPPGEADEPASEADQAKGRALLEKARESLGGDAFADIEAMAAEVDQTVETPQGSLSISMSSEIELPDRMHVVQRLPMGEITFVLNGDAGSMQGPQGAQAMPEQMRQQVRSQVWRDLVYLFARMDAENLEISAAGQQEVDGRTLTAVRVKPPEATAFTLLLDPDTHRPVRMKFQGTTMQGAPVDSMSVFEDYKTVGNIEVPHRSTVYQDGEQSAKATLTELRLNPEFDEGRFEIEE
jgi:predicted Zn-dependent peptidase